MFRFLLVLALSLTACELPAQPLAPDPETGTVEVHRETVYYEVEGATPRSLLKNLALRGPSIEGERFFGLTEWEVNAEYRWRERATRCSMEDIVVRVVIKTHLPQWVPPAGTPAEVRTAWNRFVTALDAHEDGHRRFAEEAGEAIRWHLVSLHTPSCSQIKGEAQRAVVAILDEYDALNRAYDRETGHGRTQNAVWPPAHLLAGAR
ncbi:MAG: DUF922 domain-containing protein [Bacteroidota bacterium]